MDDYQFKDGMATLSVPPMPPVCLHIGNCRLIASICVELPAVVVHGEAGNVLILRPGDTLVGLTRGWGDLEALCMESRHRHGGWNAHALGDAVRALMVHGVEWSRSSEKDAILPLLLAA